VLALEYEDLSFESYTLTCQFGVCWSAFGKMGRPAIGQSPQSFKERSNDVASVQTDIACDVNRAKRKVEQAHADLTKSNASEPNAIK